jgi:hypothetical protein
MRYPGLVVHMQSVLCALVLADHESQVHTLHVDHETGDESILV